MEEITIKKINLLSAGKLFAIYQGLVGIIFGVILGVATSILTSVVSSNPAETSMMLLSPMALMPSPIVSFIVIPISSIISGFIIGIIAALMYNLIALITGGMKLSIEKENLEESNNNQPIAEQQNQNTQQYPQQQTQMPQQSEQNQQ